MLGRAFPIGAVGALIVSAGCGSSVLMGLHPEIAQASRELDAAYAEAQKLGLPLTADDLQGPPIPDGDNGAVGMKGLLEKWQEDRPKVESGTGEVSADAMLMSSPRPAAIAAHDDPILDEVKALLERPMFQIRRDMTDPISVLFPEYAMLKGAGKALAWRAQERARAGSIQGAISDLRAVRRLGWASGQDPNLIGGLVAVALDAIAIRSAQHVAESWKDRPEALEALRLALAESHEPLSLRHSLKGEVFMGVAVTRNLEAYGGVEGMMAMMGMTDGSHGAAKEPDVSRMQADGKPADTAARAFMARHLQFWNEAMRNRDLSDVELSQKLDRRSVEIQDRKDPSQILSQVMFPVFAQAGSAFAKQEAAHEMAQAGLAVMAHRARTGALPKSLAEAGAEERISFRDQPIRYEARGGRFCLWAAGPDGREEGAQFEPKNAASTLSVAPEKPMSDDFVLTWPPVQPNRA